MLVKVEVKKKPRRLSDAAVKESLAARWGRDKKFTQAMLDAERAVLEAKEPTHNRHLLSGDYD